MQLSFWEIVTLGVLALLIFGPERLPGIARNAGRMVARFKQEASAAMEDLRQQAEVDDLRGIADEFRAQGQDLKRSMQLTGPVASEARPRRSIQGPVPFDPDAT